MRFGAPLLRAVIGPLFIGHGTQKLFGWFGGPGLEGAGGMMESLELRPPKRHALTASVAETAGGALVTLGALTPLASAMITGSMVTAIRKVHAPKGPWVTSGGYEYNLVLVTALAALTDHGPGSPSVDAWRFPRLKGPVWALASLAAGVAGSYLATSPPINEEPVREPTGRFTREREPALA